MDEVYQNLLDADFCEENYYNVENIDENLIYVSTLDGKGCVSTSCFLLSSLSMLGNDIS